MSFRDDSSEPHIIEQPIPHFLTILDDDPEVAWKEFHEFATKLLTAYPPRVFRDLPEEVRKDLLSDIVFDCRSNNFRRLRSYQYRGRPFAVWLGRMARNRAIDHERRRRLGIKIAGNAPNSGSPDVEEQVDHRSVLAVVRECIGQLGARCRVLLEAAADEFKPAEMVDMLGLAPGDNKSVSDNLRSCRRSLKRLLMKRGIRSVAEVARADL
jgi:DNA-directed RNA polymerase specialized sigma24 family protein